MNDTPAKTPQSSTPLAIIGIGCLFPKAAGLREYWSNIKNGVDAITDIPATHWRPEDYFSADQKKADHTYASRGGFLTPVDFDPLEYGIPPNVLEATDTSQLLGMVAASEALRDAGYGPGREFDRNRTSVILGVTGTLELVIPLGARLGHPIWRASLADAGVDPKTAEEVIDRIADSYVPWQENSFPGLLGNVVAGRISKQLDLGGTNCVVDAACASALSALHLAAMELSTGRSDMVITGGIDTFNDIFMYMCFSKTPALSPTGNAKPFDENGDGTILGEGLGLVVLKRLEDAERDGDRVYAVIRSIGSSSDGKGDAIYAPSASGQKKALETTYGLASVSPDTIELLEAHGTGTRVGDAVEATALREVYGNSGKEGSWCAIGSVKSQIGHTKAAAGAAGLIKAALALHYKVLPPTIKVDKPIRELAPGASPFYVNTTKRPWLPSESHPRRAAVSAFGFGGSNFHCLLEESTPLKREVDWDGSVQIIAFSGSDSAAVRAQLEKFDPKTPWNELRFLAAESRRSFRSSDPARLLLVIERDRTDPAKLSSGAKRMFDSYPASEAWATPEGAYFGTGEAPGKLGMIFPGQGSQYVGMLRDLTCHFPEMLEALTEADKAFAEERDVALSHRLSELIYPQPAFDAKEVEAQEERLRSIEVAQPAIGAVSIGALKVFEGFGVLPEAVAGHSYGELMALCAAGRFDAKALYMLSRLRGRLMAQGSGDKGAMLAVRAPLAAVEAILSEEKLDLVIANRNAPSQAVLSGRVDEIERARVACERRNIQGKRIAVAAAFHSPLVAHARTPFLSALQQTEFATATIPVFANSSAEEYPHNVEEARQLLAAQLVKPVEFVAQIETMYERGIRTFVEVGPGARLTGLVHSILEKVRHTALSIDASGGQRSGLVDLARSLAHVASLGHSVELSSWDGNLQPAAEARRKPRMTVSISGANHVTQRMKKPPAPPNVIPKEASPSPMRSMAVPERAQPAEVSRPAHPISKRSETVVPATITRLPEPQSAAASYGSQPSRSLQIFQEGMAALQRIQEQTADLHRQFLEGQNLAARTIQSLVEREAASAGGFAPTDQSNRLPSSEPWQQPVVRHDSADQKPQGLLANRAASSVLARDIPTPLITPHPSVSPERLAETTPQSSSEESANADMIGPTLLAIVAAKTGYPVEMLDLEMSLDSDLGIDSIKRVEILSALQEQLPDAPAIAAEDLGRLSTLRSIALHLSQGRGTRDEGRGTTKVQTSSAPARAAIESALIEVVASKTGYPPEMLDLEMSLDADLGIDSIKRVEIFSALQDRLPASAQITPADLGRLTTLRSVVEHLSGKAETGNPKPESRYGTGQLTAMSSGSAAPLLTNDEIEKALIEVVAGKTGYPVEMLDLEMALDADLGIDSIKRVEIFSALQDRLPESEPISPADLGRLTTLRSVVEHLSGKLGTRNQKPEVRGGAELQSSNRDSGTPSRSVVSSSVLTPAAIEKALIEVVAGKTGYPVEMLDLEMALDADLGIDSIKRVEIFSALQELLPSAPAVGAEELGRLRTLREIVAHLGGDEGRTATIVPNEEASRTKPAASLVELGVPRPVRLDRDRSVPRIPFEKSGEVWVTDDGSELASAVATAFRSTGLHARVIRISEVPAAVTRLSGLVIISPAAGASDDFLAAAFGVAKSAATSLRSAAAASGSFFVTVSRQDGAFGLLGNSSGGDFLSGGLAGLSKSAGHEWRGVSTKALDLEPGMSANELAELIVDECSIAGPSEVGIHSSGRTSLELQTRNTDGGSGALPVSAGDVVLITGGARGITAEVALELARKSKATLVLIGRSEEPHEEAPATRLLGDEAAIKRTLVSSGIGPSPRAVQDAYGRLMANREIVATLESIRAAGSTVVYRSLDIRNAAAVTELVEQIHRELGPIRGLIHGAGVLADRLIEDKTREQFELVYATKVRGAANLLLALRDDSLRFLAFFSSSTARFGRKGQADYAVANEVLNKLAGVEARKRKECRVVSLNWGPWDGGMVTPALRTLFASEGVGVIGLEEGAARLLGEISAPPGDAVEITVVARPALAATSHAEAPTARDQQLESAFTLKLSVDNFSFLRSHVMNDRAVLPLSMIMEWLAHGAMHRNPGMKFRGIENLQLYKGVTLDEESELELRFSAGKSTKDNGFQHVPCELRSTSAGREQLHARATVLLNPGFGIGSAPLAESWNHSMATALRTDPYATGVLFHGEELHSLSSIRMPSGERISALAATAPAPSRWITSPLRNSWISDPLAIDSAFQLLIVWSHATFGLHSLPTAFRSYEQFRDRFPQGNISIQAGIRSHTSHGATADITFIDGEGTVIATMQGYECVIDASLAHAFERNQLQRASFIA